MLRPRTARAAAGQACTVCGPQAGRRRVTRHDLLFRCALWSSGRSAACSVLRREGERGRIRCGESGGWLQDGGAGEPCAAAALVVHGDLLLRAESRHRAARGIGGDD